VSSALPCHREIFVATCNTRSNLLLPSSPSSQTLPVLSPVDGLRASAQLAMFGYGELIILLGGAVMARCSLHRELSS